MNQDILILNRDSSGRVSVTAKVFDDRSDLVAELENNKFLSTNRASHFKRLNESSFVVYDHLDIPVLGVMGIRLTQVAPMGSMRAWWKNTREI
jgi:hypothetical protein